MQKHAAKDLGKENKKFLQEFSRLQSSENSNSFQTEWEKFVLKFTGLNAEIRVDEDFNEDSNEERIQIIDYKSDAEDSFEINSENISPGKKKLGDYLKTLYKSRKSWAKCFTYKFFAAGIDIFSLFLTLIRGAFKIKK